MIIYKSRTAILAIISVFAGVIHVATARADTPLADFKTVTSKAYVDSLISGSDISSHTINGAALSNSSVYFYGTSSTAANQAIKDVTVTGITTPGANDHPIIVVQPEHTSTLTPISGTPEFKLRLNSDAAADAKPIYVNGAPLDIKSQDSVWNENYPSAFVFDGTNWVFLGAGYNINTVIESYKVNGTPLQKSGTFYGTSSTAATTGAKTVAINGFPLTGYTPVAGQIIVVSPAITSTYDGAHTLSVNSSTAVPIYYNGAAVTDAATAAMVWTADVPATFVYERTGGGKWVFAGRGVDSTIPAGTAGNVVTYSGTSGAPGSREVLNALNTAEEKALNMYNTTFDGTEYNWPAADATKLVSGTGLADALSHKQNKIPLTSNGTGNTPNYVYDATTNPTANGSVITTTDTAGTVSQRGIATAAIPDGTGGFTNGDWIPTVGAVMNAISPLAWTSAESNATTGYSTTFDSSQTHTTGNWLYQTEDNLVNTAALANALSLKQNIIPAGTADDVVTYSGTAGTTNSRGVLSTLDTTQNGLIGGYNDTFSGNTSTWTVDPQTNIGTGSWAASEASKLVSVQAFAKGLAKKQNQIAATSSNLTFDNTNPQSARAKSAGYSVVTTSGVAGSTGQIGVANEALYTTSNNETTLVNGEWIPNMYALDRMLNSATSGTINGASVGSASAYFYDNAGGGAASSCAKTASIPSIDTLAAGQVIVVTPATTSTCSGAHTLALNGGDAAPIYYDGAAIPHAGIAAYVWAAGRPSTFVYDGTKWLFIGDPMMSVSDGRAATNTTPRVVNPMALKAIVHGLTLSTVSGSGITALSLNTNQSGAITTSDTIIGAFGKAQGQINSLDANIGDINGRIINGMPFNGKITHQFAGPEDTTGINMTSYVRTAAIPALPTVKELTDWTVIVVQPGVTADAGKDVGIFDSYGLNLAINDPEFSLPILYNGDPVTDETAPIVWNANYPSIFVYSENAGKNGAWLFAGSGDDLPTHKVNGAPLSNASSYYYGNGTASATGITVTIPSIASAVNTLPGTGQIIVVQPTNNLNYACNTTNWKLGLNDFTAAPVVYGQNELSCNQNADEEIKKLVWNVNLPSMFVYDGKAWVFLGHGMDANTKYDALTSDASGELSGPAGTGNAPGIISPQTLKNSIHRVNLTANSGTTAFAATNSRITSQDTVIGAFGKAQGQIDNRQTLVPATGTYKTLSGTTWTSTSISDYDAAGVKGTSLPTKTGTEGNLGERMIVDSGTDTTGWATAKLANAIPSMSKISAITASMQSQKVCYEYKPGTDLNNATDADCWLWRLP